MRWALTKQNSAKIQEYHAFSFVSAEKKTVSGNEKHNADGNNCSLKHKNTVGSPAFYHCVSHTYIYSF